MVNQAYLIKALSRIRPKRILVIGDLILDRYTYGTSKRISPEAPVPVVLVESKSAQAGGCGNVALNLQALGMHSRIVSCIGSDADGGSLRSILEEANVDCQFLYSDSSSKTAVKTRVIAGSQQIVRIDEEEYRATPSYIEERIERDIDQILEGIAAIAISDYAKGFLTEKLLRLFISEAKKRSIPSITDPKGSDFRKYRGSTIIKPNAHEAMAAFGGGFSSLTEAVSHIFSEVDVETLLVTRAEKGISLYYRDGEEEHYPVTPKAVRDVTGAGDTVLALLSSALASSISFDMGIPLANIAASCAIERIGCASITLQDVALRLFDANPMGKLCDIETLHDIIASFHPEALFFILFPPQKSLSSIGIIELQKILTAKPKEAIAIAYIDEIDPCEKLLQLLASFDRIDLVTHKKESISFSEIASYSQAVYTISV